MHWQACMYNVQVPLNCLHLCIMNSRMSIKQFLSKSLLYTKSWCARMYNVQVPLKNSMRLVWMSAWLSSRCCGMVTATGATRRVWCPTILYGMVNFIICIMVWSTQFDHLSTSTVAPEGCGVVISCKYQYGMTRSAPLVAVRESQFFISMKYIKNRKIEIECTSNSHINSWQSQSFRNRSPNKVEVSSWDWERPGFCIKRPGTLKKRFHQTNPPHLDGTPQCGSTLS